MTLRDDAARWLAAGRAAMVVEVADTRGSVPREAGTRMLVGEADALGTIGGGHLELQAIAEARARRGERFERRIALGPSLGQCCGGALVLRFAPLDAAALDRWPATAPLFTLQLYGAGHVGRAIVRLLATLDCRVQWIDERESEFPPRAGALDAPHIERLCVEPVEAEVDAAAPGTCFLVLTHSHDLDLRLAEAILRRGDFRFFGLIGSATKRARFEHRLAERGLDTRRMTCPIGVPGIGGKAPEVIAVAAVAQLLQHAAGTSPAARGT